MSCVVHVPFATCRKRVAAECVTICSSTSSSSSPVEGFVFAHVAEEGLIESCELPLPDRRHRKPRDSVAAHRPYPEFLSELNRNGREVERVVVRITDEILHLQRVRIDLDAVRARCFAARHDRTPRPRVPLPELAVLLAGLHVGPAARRPSRLKVRR